VLETFEYIRDLTRYGVQFESYTEAHFRTTGMAGELMLAIAHGSPSRNGYGSPDG
jgi:hypothetical protein